MKLIGLKNIQAKKVKATTIMIAHMVPLMGSPRGLLIPDVAFFYIRGPNLSCFLLAAEDSP